MRLSELSLSAVPGLLSTMTFDWQPVLLSLRVASVALVLAFIGGTLLALLLNRRFAARPLVEGVILLPLVLPPVISGYALLVLLGRQGIVGKWLLERFDVRLIFTPTAAILASTLVALPLMYTSAKAAIDSVDPAMREAAQSLGAPPFFVLRSITLPLSRNGLLAGAILSFARALGEFGATIMVAGNIQGKTVTMPTAIYVAAENGDLQMAGIYAALLAVLNLLFLLLSGFWLRQNSLRFNG
jgi:molybdate transport system permease protein